MKETVYEDLLKLALENQKTIAATHVMMAEVQLELAKVVDRQNERLGHVESLQQHTLT